MKRKPTAWTAFEEVVPSPQGRGSRYFVNSRYEVEVREAENGLT